MQQTVSVSASVHRFIVGRSFWDSNVAAKTSLRTTEDSIFSEVIEWRTFSGPGGWKIREKHNVTRLTDVTVTLTSQSTLTSLWLRRHPETSRITADAAKRSAATELPSKMFLSWCHKLCRLTVTWISSNHLNCWTTSSYQKIRQGVVLPFNLFWSEKNFSTTSYRPGNSLKPLMNQSSHLLS